MWRGANGFGPVLSVFRSVIRSFTSLFPLLYTTMAPASLMGVRSAPVLSRTGCINRSLVDHEDYGLSICDGHSRLIADRGALCDERRLRAKPTNPARRVNACRNRSGPKPPIAAESLSRSFDVVSRLSGCCMILLLRVLCGSHHGLQ